MSSLLKRVDNPFNSESLSEISLTGGQTSNLKYLEVSRFYSWLNLLSIFLEPKEKEKEKRLFTWEMVNKTFVLYHLKRNKERKN